MKYFLVAIGALLFTLPAFALNSSEEEIAAATSAWINAMNSHDPGKVTALYDVDAILWGTRSATLRDNPGAISEYFNVLRTVDSSYRVVLGEQRIRIYNDIAINTGTYSFSEFHDGKETIRPSRFTFVYRNHDGRWMIIDHHSSALPS
jgi:uncharacterized protein (TIGR02246 family)